MGESSEELQRRLKEKGDVLRKGLVPLGAMPGESSRQKAALDQNQATTQYAEAVVAVLLDSLDSYIKASEKTREAQERFVEKQALAASQMAFWTKGLVLVTCLLIVTTAFVGLVGPIFARATAPIEVRLIAPRTGYQLRSPVAIPEDQQPSSRD
jgi:hypothetical protein